MGYFTKDVKDFIGKTDINETPFDLPHPALGPLGDQARAATGSSDGGKQRAAHNKVHIGVIHDDDGVVAAKLEERTT